MLAELGGQLDPTRTHFLGKVPYTDYKKVLQVSSAHVYLTYPFVFSWSCLEAMATGCLLVAGDTAPVREVLQTGRNGLEVTSLSAAAAADRLQGLLGHRTQDAGLRAKALRSAQAFSRGGGLRHFTESLKGETVPQPSSSGGNPPPRHCPTNPPPRKLKTTGAIA
jgi:glycosyltransferase involved in cell wall biosynthesis